MDGLLVYIDPADDLDALATQINTKVREAEDTARNAVVLAVHAGRMLSRAKILTGHGGWIEWCQNQFPNLSHRSINNYMLLARTAEALPEPDWQRVANLPLRQALKAISNPADGPVVERLPNRLEFQRRDVRERLKDEMLKSATAIRAATKFMSIGAASGRDITRARSALKSALDTLDAMVAASNQDDGESELN